MKLITLRLFGAFRNYKDTLQVEIDSGATVQDVKRLLLEYFDNPSLISESAIADDKQILASQDLIGDRSHLAVLPPVCGG